MQAAQVQDMASQSSRQQDLMRRQVLKSGGTSIVNSDIKRSVMGSHKHQNSSAVPRRYKEMSNATGPSASKFMSPQPPNKFSETDEIKSAKFNRMSMVEHYDDVPKLHLVPSRWDPTGWKYTEIDPMNHTFFRSPNRVNCHGLSP